MKIKIVLLFGIVIILMVFNSCSSMYIPSMPNIPLLENKGEAQISLGVSTNSFHLSGDYAFSAKYAIQVNGDVSYGNISNNYDIFSSKETNVKDGLEVGEFSRRYAEFGIGKYKIPIKNWKIETYLGSGYGTGYENDKDVHSRYNLGFIQGNIGRKLKRHNFEFGFAARLAYSNFKLKYLNEHTNIEDTFNFENVGMEQCAFMRVGWKSMRFYGKVGLNMLYCFYTSDPFEETHLYTGSGSRDFNYTSVHISVGVNYKFGQIKK